MPRAGRRERGVEDVETLAWLLDNAISVPGTGGRRVGLDAIIGFVPVVGDVLSAGLGLFVVLRAAQRGVPGVVVTRMLANSALDFAIGSIPVIGDAFDLWFKANTRNLRLMRRYVETPEASTRGEWLGLVALIAGALVLIGLFAWLAVSVLGTEIGMIPGPHA